MSATPDGAPAPRPLNVRQLRFVREYLVDGCAAAAARRAGYAQKAGRWAARDLMRNGRVRAAIAEARAARDAPLTREAAIEGLRRIALADVLDYARTGPDGAVELDLARLAQDRGGAVKGLSVVERTDPRTGAVTRTVSFELADRAAALARLLPLLKADAAGKALDRGYAQGVQSVLELEVEEFERLKAFEEAKAREAGYRGVKSGAELARRQQAFWMREHGLEEAAAWETASEAELAALDGEWAAAEARAEAKAGVGAG